MSCSLFDIRSRVALLLAALLALLAIAPAHDAHAQAAALKPITFVVGYPPGGSTDVLARLYAEGLAARLGTSVTVINRPGASSRIAVGDVKRAAADANVFLFTNASPMVIFPHIYADLGYDPQRDFVPVAVGAKTDLVLSVGPAVPASVKSLKDYIAWVKADPARASFGAVQGTSPHFAGQFFANAAGLELQLIPYKGGAQAVTDLLGGHVPAVVTNLGEARPFVKDGALRMLALTSARRSAPAPDVPTMAEQGYPSVNFPGWAGLFAPARTAPALVERLNAEFTRMAEDPVVVEKIHSIGLEPDPISTAAFKALVESDLQNYRKAVALTGFKAND